jgi:hypothetical protein
MTLWACLVLLLLLATPEGVDGAAKKKKKKKSSSGTKKKARVSRQEAEGLDDDVSPPSSAYDRVGEDGGDEDPGFRAPIPETRDDALVFHSESTPESSWSWRNTKKRLSDTWESASASAGSVTEKLHLPSKREREMVWYYAGLIGSRVKAQWDAVDWDQVAEEVPEIKGFRKTWSEFQNATGFSTGWTSALTSPLYLLFAAGKWMLALAWSLCTSPFTTTYRVLRWFTSTWWSTLLSIFVGYVLVTGTEVKVKVTPSGMPALPEGAEEVQRLPKKGNYTLVGLCKLNAVYTHSLKAPGSNP